MNQDRGNVFVKFLPSDMDDAGLHSLFSPFGDIISAKVMVNVSTGGSLGYGFVRYTNSEDASQAIVSMMGHRIGKKSLLCKLSDSFSFTEPCPNLFIKPLPRGISEKALRLLFGKFGTILDAKVVSLEKIAVGFVRYDTAESASQAILDMNCTKITGQDQVLTVKFADSDRHRATRKAKLSPCKGEMTTHGEASMSPPSVTPTIVMTPMLCYWPSYTYVPQPNLMNYDALAQSSGYPQPNSAWSSFVSPSWSSPFS